jgi:hypothetical protein
VYGIVSRRSALRIDHSPATSSNCLDARSDPASRETDDEMPHWADHEQEPERVADESWDADQDAACENDQSVEQLPRRHLAAGEPFLGMDEHAEAHAFHDEGSKRAYGDQDGEGPEKAELFGDRDECSDFCGYEEKAAKEEHIAGYRRHQTCVVAAKASTDAPPATSRRRSLRGLVLEVVVLIEILEKPEMGGSPIEEFARSRDRGRAVQVLGCLVGPMQRRARRGVIRSSSESHSMSPPPASSPDCKLVTGLRGAVDGRGPQ